jgi:two-component sensor histidine kinase
MAKRKTPKAQSTDIDVLRRHIAILIDLGRLAGTRVPIDKFLDQVVVRVARAVEIDHVKVLLYRQATSDFIVAAGYGWKEGVVRRSTLAADLTSPAGRAFLTGEPVAIPNVSATDFEMPAMLTDHGIIALTNVPIFVDGAAGGVLEVDSTVPCDFNSDTTDFLMAAAGMIGGALQKQVAERSDSEALSATLEAQYQDLLLREMQHRVKNNFQVILASIAIQKRRYHTPEARNALAHVESRIQAISLAHDQLAPRQGQIIRLEAYIRALCASIEQQAEGVGFDLKLDDVELAIDRAVPVGLILNEIATNSIKYAFGEAGGRITVSLVGGIGYGEARLTVSDNGRGIKPDAVPGSGTGLMTSLARQIGGTTERQSSGRGTAVTLTFPVIA